MSKKNHDPYDRISSPISSPPPPIAKKKILRKKEENDEVYSPMSSPMPSSVKKIIANQFAPSEVELSFFGTTSPAGSPPSRENSLKSKNIPTKSLPSNKSGAPIVDEDDVDIDEEPEGGFDDRTTSSGVVNNVNPLVLAGVRMSREISRTVRNSSSVKDPTYSDLHGKKERRPCLERHFLCCSFQECLFPFSRKHKTTKLYQVTCGAAWFFIFIFMIALFSYIGVALDYYKLVACQADEQTCYKIMKVQPADLCSAGENVNEATVDFKVQINLNIPSKNGIAIGKIRQNTFYQTPSTTSFGSLDMDVSFLYPDGHSSPVMNGGAGVGTFECIVDGKFTVTDEQSLANIFSKMMNSKYFDVTASMSVPIIITGFWPFTFTYVFNYALDYRCESGFSGEDPICWMPPKGVSEDQYAAAKLAIHKMDLALAAKWKAVNPSPRSTILTVDAAGLTPSNSTSDISSTAAVNATLSINMGGNFVVAEVPYLTAKVYMSGNNIDPFSTESPNVNLAFEPVMNILVNPFTMIGLGNGGPFNVSAVGGLIAPSDVYKIDTLRSMIGLYLKLDNIYLYVQGNSDPVNDSCLTRRIFSLMPPMVVMMNSTGTDTVPNIALLSNGDMASYCAEQALTQFSITSVEILGLNADVLTVQAIINYPFKFSMSGFAPPVGFLVSFGENNHTIAKFSTRSFPLVKGSTVYTVILDVTIVDGNYALNDIKSMITSYDLVMRVKGDPTFNIISALLGDFEYTLAPPDPNNPLMACAVYLANQAALVPKLAHPFGFDISSYSDSSSMGGVIGATYFSWTQTFKVFGPSMNFSVGLPRNGIINGSLYSSMQIQISEFDMCQSGCLNQVNISYSLQVVDDGGEFRQFMSDVGGQKFTPILFYNSSLNNRINSRSGVAFASASGVGMFNSVWSSFSDTYSAVMGSGTYTKPVVSTGSSYQVSVNTLEFIGLSMNGGVIDLTCLDNRTCETSHQDPLNAVATIAVNLALNMSFCVSLNIASPLFVDVYSVTPAVLNSSYPLVLFATVDIMGGTDNGNIVYNSLVNNGYVALTPTVSLLNAGIAKTALLSSGYNIKIVPSARSSSNLLSKVLSIFQDTVSMSSTTTTSTPSSTSTTSSSIPGGSSSAVLSVINTASEIGLSLNYTFSYWPESFNMVFPSMQSYVRAFFFDSAAQIASESYASNMTSKCNPSLGTGGFFGDQSNSCVISELDWSLMNFVIDESGSLQMSFSFISYDNATLLADTVSFFSKGSLPVGIRLQGTTISPKYGSKSTDIAIKATLNSFTALSALQIYNEAVTTATTTASSVQILMLELTKMQLLNGLPIDLGCFAPIQNFNCPPGLSDPGLSLGVRFAASLSLLPSTIQLQMTLPPFEVQASLLTNKVSTTPFVGVSVNELIYASTIDLPLTVNIYNPNSLHNAITLFESGSNSTSLYFGCVSNNALLLGKLCSNYHYTYALVAPASSNLTAVLNVNTTDPWHASASMVDDVNSVSLNGHIRFPASFVNSLPFPLYIGSMNLFFSGYDGLPFTQFTTTPLFLKPGNGFSDINLTIGTTMAQASAATNFIGQFSNWTAISLGIVQMNFSVSGSLTDSLGEVNNLNVQMFLAQNTSVVTSTSSSTSTSSAASSFVKAVSLAGFDTDSTLLDLSCLINGKSTQGLCSVGRFAAEAILDLNFNLNSSLLFDIQSPPLSFDFFRTGTSDDGLLARLSVGSTPENGKYLDLTSQTEKNGILDISLLGRVSLYDWTQAENIALDYGNKDVSIRFQHTYSASSTLSAVLQKFYYIIDFPVTTTKTSSASRMLPVSSQVFNVSLTNGENSTAVNVIINVPSSFAPGFPVLLPNTSFNVNYLSGLGSSYAICSSISCTLASISFPAISVIAGSQIHISMSILDSQFNGALFSNVISGMLNEKKVQLQFGGSMNSVYLTPEFDFSPNGLINLPILNDMISNSSTSTTNTTISNSTFSYMLTFASMNSGGGYIDLLCLTNSSCTGAGVLNFNFNISAYLGFIPTTASFSFTLPQLNINVDILKNGTNTNRLAIASMPSITFNSAVSNNIFAYPYITLPDASNVQVLMNSLSDTYTTTGLLISFNPVVTNQNTFLNRVITSITKSYTFSSTPSTTSSSSIDTGFSVTTIDTAAQAGFAMVLTLSGNGIINLPYFTFPAVTFDLLYVSGNSFLDSGSVVISGIQTPALTANQPLVMTINMIVNNPTQMPNFQSLNYQLWQQGFLTYFLLQTQSGNLNVDFRFHYQDASSPFIVTRRRVLEDAVKLFNGDSVEVNDYVGRGRSMAASTSMFTLGSLYFLGAADGGIAAIPCVLDVVCPPIASVAALYPNGVSYQLRLDFTLDLSSISVQLAARLSTGFGIQLTCCGFSLLATAYVSPITITTAQKSYSLMIGVTIVNVALLNTALNDLGVIQVDFIVSGSTQYTPASFPAKTYSAFSNAFKNVAYKTTVAATTNLTANGAPPSWIFPLFNSGPNGSGSWSLVSTSANTLQMAINFPISYPLSTTLTFSNVLVYIVYQGINVLSVVPSNPGDGTNFVLRPSTANNQMQITLSVILDPTDPNCPGNLPSPAKYPDRCTVGNFMSSLIARAVTDMTLKIQFNGPSSTPVYLSLSMELFRGYWLQNFARGQLEYQASLFSIFKYPVSSSFHVNFGSTLWASIKSGSITAALTVDLVNPFFTGVYANTIGFDLVMDDRDGSDPTKSLNSVEQGLAYVVSADLTAPQQPSFNVINVPGTPTESCSSWTIANGYQGCTVNKMSNYIFKNQVVNANNLFIPRGTCKSTNGVQSCTTGAATSPTIPVTVSHDDESFGAFASRVYDGYKKSLLCIHLLNGYIDLTFQLPGSSGFPLRQPFTVPNINALGDFDCQPALTCIPLSNGPNPVSNPPLSITSGGFSTSNFILNQASSAKSVASGAGPAFSNGNILLTKYNYALNSAWYKTKVNVLKSWTATFTYTEGLDSSLSELGGCYVNCGSSGKGYGFAFVIQDASTTTSTVGSSTTAPVDFTSYNHGYSGIPNSAAVIFDLYNINEVAIAQNGDATTSATSPYSVSDTMTNGWHAFTDLETSRGPWKLDLQNGHTIKIVYTAANNYMYVFISDGGVDKEILSSYVNLTKSVQASSNGTAYIGFTGMTENNYHYTGTVQFSQVTISQLSFQQVTTSVSQSLVQQNGLVITASNLPGRFTLNAKDSCGFDVPQGGDSWLIQLVLSTNSQFTVTCSAVDLFTGLYTVNCPISPMGTYNVMAKINGGTSWSQVGSTNTIIIRSAVLVF